MNPLHAMFAFALLSGCSPRCPNDAYYSDLEIGIGTRRFIEVPPGYQVSPDSTDPSYFNLALRGYGFQSRDLVVQLKAFVGDRLFAENTHEGVNMRCMKWDTRERAHLRLDLDPSLLPPLPSEPPPEPEPQPQPLDTGWWVDTGYYREDPGWKADVRIEASVLETNGRLTQAEALWFIYR